MRRFVAGIIFVLVVAILGFLYRNAIEQPHQIGSQTVAAGTACTADAKICPDGTVVSRGGPDCSFAVCPLPNIEIDLASTTLSFVLPSGYEKSVNEESTDQVSANQSNSGSGSVLGTYTQTTVDQSDASTITLSEYQIPAGGSGSAEMLAQTIFTPSGLTATSTNEFSTEVIGRNTFSSIVLGETQGEVQSAYYVQNGNDLFRFDLAERGVQNATDPGLDIKTLPQHEALAQMLATLQIQSNS